MGHVTFIHGIANKPEPNVLLEQWRAGLFDDDGLDLDGMGVTTSMVYWADMLYAEPAPLVNIQESTDLELASSVGAEDANLGWLTEVPSEERDFVLRVAREVGLADVTPTEGPLDPVVPASTLEAVPLPGWLKQRLMRVFLRDVHHYLFDSEFSPRPGSSFRIRRDVRSRALEVLQEGASRPGPHVVVAHSLGTVIAYDVLTAVDGAPRVDALMTIGSPLGISEVQQKLDPWTSDDGWPSQRLGGGPWFNVYDPLDPVCGGLDRRIAGSYRLLGKTRVVDLSVSNRGSWRHTIGKYLGQEQLRSCLRAVVE